MIGEHYNQALCYVKLTLQFWLNVSKQALINGMLSTKHNGSIITDLYVRGQRVLLIEPIKGSEDEFELITLIVQHCPNLLSLKLRYWLFCLYSLILT